MPTTSTKEPVGMVMSSSVMGLTDLAFPGKNEELFVTNFSPYINIEKATVIYREMNLAFLQISQNGNPKVIFTDLVLKMVKLINSKN